MTILPLTSPKHKVSDRTKNFTWEGSLSLFHLNKLTPTVALTEIMASSVRFPFSTLMGNCLSHTKRVSTTRSSRYPVLLTHYISRPKQTSCITLRRWNSNKTNPTEKTFLQRFLAPKPMPPRNTPAWYKEMILICTVFAITGSSTMFLVRPAMTKVLGLEGSLRDGPWSYRICSIVIMTPLYATLLVCVGTVFGRHAYFRHFSVKMFSRFGIPPSLMDSNFERNAKNFKKW